MTQRQLVKYSFYTLDQTFLRLPAEKQRAAKLDFIREVRSFNRQMLLRPYTLVGMRSDVDFLLWQIANEIEPLQALATAIRMTELGPYLRMTRSYLSGTKRSLYDITLPGDDDVDNRESIVVEVSDQPYLFIYPFIKTRQWYALSPEERQQMITEHITIGRKYPDIKLNTTYSYGIDDQEFVVAFEGTNPHEFIDLVNDLRFTEASMYTLRDTPMHICLARPLPEMLDTLGGAAVAHLVEEDITETGGWLDVADVDDLPEGETRLVYYGREQVGLFNVEGELYAINNRCPHARGPLHEGEVTCDGGHSVRCPWHEAYFDLRDGQVISGPSPRGVETFAVKVEDGRIHIARGVMEAAHD